MTSESAIQNQVRLAAAYAGLECWRNNVGVLMAVDDYGNQRPVRYGLANDSAKVNKEIKSSDLIGITPVLITPEHLGRTLGVFTAFETKRSGWTMRDSDKHALAQQRFHDIVRRAGGFAGFVSDPQHIFKIIGRET